eukprot:753410-Hanusia_phi.AAC.8
MPPPPRRSTSCLRARSRSALIHDPTLVPLLSFALTVGRNRRSVPGTAWPGLPAPGGGAEPATPGPPGLSEQ